METDRSNQGELLVPVAANETVETPAGQTFMIIQEKVVDSVSNGMEDGSLQIAVSEVKIKCFMTRIIA